METFDNTCTIMDSNSKKDIIYKNKEFIENNKLDSYLEIILDPLFSKKVFNNNLTVKEYLVQNKVPEDKINSVIELYKTILNDNIMISGLTEYNLDSKSLMMTLVNTIYVDNLRNSMVCVISDKKVLDMLIQQFIVLINTPKVEICTKEKFIEYCDKNYSAQIQASNIEPKVKVTSEIKPSGEIIVVGEVVNKKEIEKFANELEESKKEIDSGTMKILDIEKQMLPLINNNPKFMDAKSITEVMNSFSEKSFGPDVEKQLKTLIDKYQATYGKKVNLIDIKEFGNLVKMLIDELKLIIIRLVDEDNIDKLKVIIDDFDAHKKIFYLFKHNYKVVQAYKIINEEVSDNDEKLRAILCCNKSDTPLCHNFSTIAKDSRAIIFGFNKLGYANTIKCVKDSDEARKLYAEQERTLDDILSSRYELWNKISKDEKMVIMDNFNKLLKINEINVSNINGNLGDIRQEIGGQNKLNMDQLFLTLTIKPHDISTFFKLSQEFVLKSAQVMKLENVNDIQNYLNKFGFNKDQIVFNPNVNLDYAKKITIGLMTVQEVLSNFNYKDSANVVAKLFGIMDTTQTFGEILKNTNIQSRYHNIILEYIIKNIEAGNYAVIEKYDINSVPGAVIKYLQSKPSDMNLNICNVRGAFLQKLRKDRTISLNEFDEYNKQLEILCNPSKIVIKDIISQKIPIDTNKGLPVIERIHKNYDEFIKEHKEIEKYNLQTEVVSDEILYNLIKNIYN